MSTAVSWRVATSKKEIIMRNMKNVMGKDLQTCSLAPMTGYLRNGTCETGPRDLGSHTVCAQVTQQLLDFTKSRGNDLSSPIPGSGFPGLKPGDRRYLCALRWKEARDAGVAPPVYLEATHDSVLRNVSLEDLKRHALMEK
jgi:uncharacterized protein (DUF2237 family)